MPSGSEVGMWGVHRVLSVNGVISDENEGGDFQ